MEEYTIDIDHLDPKPVRYDLLSLAFYGSMREFTKVNVDTIIFHDQVRNEEEEYMIEEGVWVSVRPLPLVSYRLYTKYGRVNNIHL